MHHERKIKAEKERCIKIQFVYDPNFTPSWFEKGEIDDSLPTINYSPLLYARSRSEEWNNQFSPLISDSFAKNLGIHSFPFPNLTCFVLDHRIKTNDNLFLEAYSNPLAIWAIPPEDRWGYLPFHARLTHELIHLARPNSSYWESLEDEVWKKTRENDHFWKDRSLREELVVRDTTHKITKEVFGQEFADWFLNRESKVISTLGFIS